MIKKNFQLYFDFSLVIIVFSFGNVFYHQTEEQYIFIHDALLEAIQSGDTNIPRAGLSRYIRMLQAPGGSQEKPQPWYLLSHQFKVWQRTSLTHWSVEVAVDGGWND